MKGKQLSLLAAIALSCSNGFAADDQWGRSIGSACLGCHGAAASSGAAIPPIIIGAPAAYTESALKLFRDGKRPSTIMQRIAKGYSDEDIAAVAKYFESLGGK